MIKTYEIDLDDSLVDSAEDIFGRLGTDVDTAIKVFLNQAVLRKGFPFEVVIPEENKPSPDKIDSRLLNSETEFAESKVPEDEAQNLPVSPEIAARVAANETLVKQMRSEIGGAGVIPEFDENEDDGTRGDYEQAEIATPASEYESESAAESGQKSEPEAEGDEEDEDETTPDNLFDAWDAGDEEEIGCR